MLDLLHGERFVDMAPKQVQAVLLEEGVYHCSDRTMHRLLAAKLENRERRRQRTHPKRPEPRLEATAPNQVWSWDITRLPGPGRGRHFALYVVLDLYSRYVVGWMVAEKESSELAARFIHETCRREGVDPKALTVHQDRGAPMTGREFWQMAADLGLDLSYGRPRVSNDNAYSESQFKTMKYVPTYPGWFDSIEAARAWCKQFMHWYNHEHRHSGIAMLAPHAVHAGKAQEILDARRRTLELAFAIHPERFVNGPPTVKPLPTSVWINDPARKSLRVAGVA